jgi:hypothetical protein
MGVPAAEGVKKLPADEEAMKRILRKLKMRSKGIRPGKF